MLNLARLVGGVPKLSGLRGLDEGTLRDGTETFSVPAHEGVQERPGSGEPDAVVFGILDVRSEELAPGVVPVGKQVWVQKPLTEEAAEARAVAWAAGKAGEIFDAGHVKTGGSGLGRAQADSAPGQFGKVAFGLAGEAGS